MKWINILEGIRTLERGGGFERKFSSVVRTAVFNISLLKTFPLGKHELENGKLQENTLRVREIYQFFRRFLSGNYRCTRNSMEKKVRETFVAFAATAFSVGEESENIFAVANKVLVCCSNFGRTKLRIVCLSNRISEERGGCNGCAWKY